MPKVTGIFARRPVDGGPPDPSSILAALSVPLFVVDDADGVSYVNQAAEQFFDTSTAGLIGRPLGEILPEDSAIFGLIRQVREGSYSVSEYGVTLSSPKIGSRFVSIDAAALGDRPGSVVVSIHERSIARKIAPRRRPLGDRHGGDAGARGQEPAVGHPRRRQLLEQNAAVRDDRQLTR
jgi:two-component system, NtrC family, nitrogen regulation sensor histidine kinase GlnL